MPLVGLNVNYKPLLTITNLGQEHELMSMKHFSIKHQYHHTYRYTHMAYVCVLKLAFLLNMVQPVIGMVS